MSTVMICDDDLDLRECLRLQLETDGHSVVDASNAWQGYELARATDPEFVITDAQMPRSGDGARLCFMLATAKLKARVFVLSGDPREQPLARAAGCERFFLKSDAAIEKIRQLLKSSAPAPRLTVVA